MYIHKKIIVNKYIDMFTQKYMLLLNVKCKKIIKVYDLNLRSM